MTVNNAALSQRMICQIQQDGSTFQKAFQKRATQRMYD